MIKFVAKAILPTRFGEFGICAFKEGENEHIVLIKGELKQGILVRVHSKCFTGDTLGSLRCDCRKQLEKSLELIAKEGGMLIYLDQEGRGIGLANKIRAYSLQDSGLDTVDANKELGFHNDPRDYSSAAKILAHFSIKRIRLLTNNPKKTSGLEGNGIKIERIPLLTEPNKYNKRYMETKKRRMNHLIE